MSVLLSISSNCLRTFSFLTNKVVSLPKECNTPASSTEIYPAPTITAFLGCFGKASKKSSEVIPNSLPGILGIEG